MSNVIRFRLKNKPTRTQVMQWLEANYDAYPKNLDNHRSELIFAGWRFIRGLDDEIYFANCIDAGISESEFNDERAHNSLSNNNWRE